MFSVTQWIKKVLIKIVPKELTDFSSKLKEIDLETIRDLLETEGTVSPQKIGTVVDYLTRLVIDQEFENTFRLIRRGMDILLERHTLNSKERSIYSEDEEIYKALIEAIDERGVEIVLSDELIKKAIRLIKYENFFRSGVINLIKPREPSINDIENIRILVERSVYFLENYDSKVICGGVISTKTTIISTGDWDYLTKDSLIDMKVSKSKPDKYEWLQLTTYFLLGKESEDPDFKSVDKLIVLNPKLAKIWILNTKDIPKKLINLIRTEWGDIDDVDFWEEFFK